MGTKYPGVTSSGYNSSAPADDGSQVASNLVTWASVKTKLADPIKALADAENTALVSALDLSARAISTPDTAVASDHWKTLQVTGTTTITLSSAASMGAGYEVGVFNAGVGVVTVTPGAAADTINGLSASVTVSIKGTKIFRTNQALTGYNVVGGYDPQTVTASTSVVTPLVGAAAGVATALQANGTTYWRIWDGVTGVLLPNTDNTLTLGLPGNRIATVFTPIIDSGTTGSLSIKTNNGTEQARFLHTGTAINVLTFTGSAGSSVGGAISIAGSDTNAGLVLSAKGNESIRFFTNLQTNEQVRILHQSAGSNLLTLAGGTNPTISTTAGSLAITPAVVMASSLVWGTGVANFGTITKRKTADESVTSSTVLQDDDHLTFAIAANEEWEADYTLRFGDNLSLGGVKIAITVPAGATMFAQSIYVGNNQTAGPSFSTVGTTSGTAFLTITSASETQAMVIIHLWVLNGATPGNITLQFAQATSNGTATTSKKGGKVNAVRVA